MLQSLSRIAHNFWVKPKKWLKWPSVTVSYGQANGWRKYQSIFPGYVLVWWWCVMSQWCTDRVCTDAAATEFSFIDDKAFMWVSYNRQLELLPAKLGCIALSLSCLLFSSGPVFSCRHLTKQWILFSQNLCQSVQQSNRKGWTVNITLLFHRRALTWYNLL